MNNKTHQQNQPKKTWLLLSIITLISTVFIGLTAKQSYANLIPNFLSNGSSLLSGLNKKITSLKNTDLTDLIQSLQTALNPSQKSQSNQSTASQNQENKPYGSYNIEQAKQRQQTIKSAYEYTQQTTFSDKAKQQQQDLADATQNNVDSNKQLSQDSQTSDVSQDILRNLSGQLALISEQNSNLIIQQENQQNNSALTNTLLTQQAQEIREQNNKNRTEFTATSNFTSRQIAQLRPAGLPLDDNNNSTSQTSTQTTPLNPNQVFTDPTN